MARLKVVLGWLATGIIMVLMFVWGTVWTLAVPVTAVLLFRLFGDWAYEVGWWPVGALLRLGAWAALAYLLATVLGILLTIVGCPVAGLWLGVRRILGKD